VGRARAAAREATAAAAAAAAEALQLNTAAPSSGERVWVSPANAVAQGVKCVTGYSTQNESSEALR
jgi:hypothetical protein